MSTANTIYDQLRQAIIEGMYSSGEALRQDQIAKDYGVSKIPVREALVQLESDGFVEIFSGRGAFVSRLSVSQAEEIYVIRIALEPVLLERAIPLTPETAWLRAGGILAALEAENLPYHQWHALDFEFHTSLYHHADLPMMKKIVTNLHHNLARYYRVYEILGAEFRKAGEVEHRDILAACQANNIQIAMQELSNHLTRSKDQLLKSLKSEIESDDRS